MLQVDSLLKTIYKNDYFPACEEIATKRNVFYFPSLGLTIGAERNNQVVSGTYYLRENLCSTDNLEFGACESSQIEVQLANVTDLIVGETMIVTQVVNETYTIAMGTFRVESCLKVDDTVFKKVIARDNMQLFDKDIAIWYNSIDWTKITTIKLFRESLYSYIGIQYESVTLCNDDMPVSKTIFANELNGLYVLRKIMQINGCFGHIGRDGTLYHVILPTLSATASETVTLNQELKFVKFQDYIASAIDKVKISQEDQDAEEDIGAIFGNGTNCYTIQGNFLTYGWSAEQMARAAENVSVNIFNRPYKPITDSELIGLPYVEVGDKLNFIIGSETYSSYVLRRELCVSKMRDVYMAYGDEVLSQIMSKNDEIEKLKGKSNVLKRTVEEMTNTISEINNSVDGLNENVSELKQTSDEISSTVSSINSKAKYELIITSSNGNIFKNGDIQTILYAVVKSWDDDITASIDPNQLIWTRVSSDTVSDQAWNTSHAGGNKSIVVTRNDVRARATFFCDLIDTTTRQSLL